MAGSTTSTAEHRLAELVKMAAESERAERGAPTANFSKTEESAPSEPGTATILGEHEGLVVHVVSQVLSRSRPSADLIEDLLAAGRLALLEAKRAYEPENPAHAVFATFAHPRVKSAVVDALAAHRGVPRGIYRAAKREAANARAKATEPLEVQTEQWIARTLEAGVAWQNLEPFTDIGWALEREDLYAAIERIPSIRERAIVRMVGLQGLAQRAAGERLGTDQAGASKALKSGFETLRDLLVIGSALDPAQLPSTLDYLADPRQRDAIRLLYGDRLEPVNVRGALCLSSAEFRSLHHHALQAIKRVVVDREHSP
jgi:RNA polymerase sigma factor (sigma-70 family)